MAETGANDTQHDSVHKGAAQGASISSLGSGIQEILDSIPFYVMLIDQNHRILLANRATRNALDLEPQDIIGEYCPRIIHGIEDGTYPGCPLEEAIEKKRGVQREHQDEKTGRWLRIGIFPTETQTADGEKIYLHMVEDITMHKDVMIALQESKEIYRRLFEGSSRHEKR